MQFWTLSEVIALIHIKNDYDTTVNTALLIVPAVALVFYAISYHIAPVAAQFFHEEQITVLIRVLSLTFVIWSFGSLPKALLTKDLEFKKLVTHRILPKIAYGVVAIVMAIKGFGVWRLVGGQLVFEVLNDITVWYAQKWISSLRIDSNIAIELLNYVT